MSRAASAKIAAILLEQVADDDAARRLVGFDADEGNAPVVARHLPLGQRLQDGAAAVVKAKISPDLFLPRMIVGDGEGGQLIEIHLAFAIEVEQRRADGSELEPLPDDGGGDAEPRGDILGAMPCSR